MLSNAEKLKRLRTSAQVLHQLEQLNHWFYEGGGNSNESRARAREWEQKLTRRLWAVQGLEKPSRRVRAQKTIAKAYHQARARPTPVRGSLAGRGFRNFMNSVAVEKGGSPRSASPRRSPRPSSPRSPALAPRANANTIMASLERKFARLQNAVKKGEAAKAKRIALEMKPGVLKISLTRNYSRVANRLRQMHLVAANAAWPNQY